MSLRSEIARRPSAFAERIFVLGLASSSNEAYVNQRNRLRNHSSNLLELLVSYALILSSNWTSDPLRHRLFWTAILWICASIALSSTRSRSVALRITEFWRSLWIVGAALLLAAPTIAIAAKMHTLQQPHGPMGGSGEFVGYAAWAVAQQWLLQGYFLPRLAQVTRSEKGAAALVAGLFAAAHLPNLVLTILALLWGLAASLLFLRFRSIVTLGFAHAILGIAVAISIPGPVLHNMRVGIAYLQYRTPGELRMAQDDHRLQDATWNKDRGHVYEYDR